MIFDIFAHNTRILYSEIKKIIRTRVNVRSHYDNIRKCVFPLVGLEKAFKIVKPRLVSRVMSVRPTNPPESVEIGGERQRTSVLHRKAKTLNEKKSKRN